MTDIETLHDQYMTAVNAALEAHNCNPKQAEWGRISDGEHLDAVLTYPASSVWEHGLTVYWDERTGWQYTALDAKRRGTNADDLPIEYLAAPSVVARAISALLTGHLVNTESSERWEHADQLQAAIDEENAS
jgi:hypothetical protein